MPQPNQNPEQLARDQIDQLLMASGWIIQHKSKINLKAGTVTKAGIKTQVFVNRNRGLNACCIQIPKVEGVNYLVSYIC